MDYYQQDFMIKLGETASGKIIEVPDILIYGLAIGFIVTILFMSAGKEDLKWNFSLKYGDKKILTPKVN